MIYTIGEIVLDIILKTLTKVNIRPGGSMLNTAISLGRLKIPVNHISILANDKAAELLIQFLQDNGVGCSYLYRDEQIKTNLALAFLDKNNNAQYSFYKEKLISIPLLKFPSIHKNDIVHFGSYFSLNQTLHPQLIDFLTKAKQLGGILLYDPNFRKPHLHQLEILKPFIEKNISLAHLIKGSNEDFDLIYNVNCGMDAWDIVKKMGAQILIYTKGTDGVELFSNKYQITIPAIQVKTKSTIGAGDTFSAGILYTLSLLLKKDKTIQDIQENEWINSLQVSTKFASETCQSYDNYLSANFAKSFINV